MKDKLAQVKPEKVTIPYQYVYHATPYAKEILEQGFIIDPDTQTFGMGHTKNYVSTTTLENALEYAAALRIIIDAINNKMDWNDLELEAKNRGYTDSQILNAYGQAVPTKDVGNFNLSKELANKELTETGTEISEEENSRRKWVFIKFLGPAFKGNSFPFISGMTPPEHLLGKSSEDVGVIESVIAPVEYYTHPNQEDYRSPELSPLISPWQFEEEEQEPKGKYTYAPSEKEWRFYDITDLWPIRLVGKTLINNKYFIINALDNIFNVISNINKSMELNMKKTAIIRKCKKGDAKEGKPWCLYTHDGSKLLGRHPTKESAIKQEQAIKAQGRIHNVICSLDCCADEPEELSFRYNRRHKEDEYEISDEEIFQFIEMQLDEWDLSDLKEYGEELINKGLFSNPEEFDTLTYEVSAVADEQIEINDLEDVFTAITLYEDSSSIKTELILIMIEFIMKNEDEKEKWENEYKLEWEEQNELKKLL